MDVDYEEYADGEALLGWLNATVRVSSDSAFDGNELLIGLAGEIQGRLRAQRAEIAHLKMTLSPDEGNDLAVANLVRDEGTAELSHRLQEPLEEGQLILNLRAEADPEILKAAALDALDVAAARASVLHRVEHLEHFRPGKPTPTHRLAGI
jgi:hypothetical protein